MRNFLVIEIDPKTQEEIYSHGIYAVDAESAAIIYVEETDCCNDNPLYLNEKARIHLLVKDGKGNDKKIVIKAVQRTGYEIEI